MKISPEFLFEISSQILNYSQICDALGLTEEERKSPNAGAWIVDRFKQLQTVALLSNQMAAKKNGVSVDRPGEINQPNPLAANPIDTPLKDSS